MGGAPRSAGSRRACARRSAQEWAAALAASRATLAERTSVNATLTTSEFSTSIANTASAVNGSASASPMAATQRRMWPRPSVGCGRNRASDVAATHLGTTRVCVCARALACRSAADVRTSPRRPRVLFPRWAPPRSPHGPSALPARPAAYAGLAPSPQRRSAPRSRTKRQNLIAASRSSERLNRSTAQQRRDRSSRVLFSGGRRRDADVARRVLPADRAVQGATQRRE